MRRQFRTHIRDAGAHKDPRGECCACAKPATHWVRIAYTYMRGEDEVEGVCARHSSMANDPGQLDRFYAHMRTKGRFLAKAEGL